LNEIIDIAQAVINEHSIGIGGKFRENVEKTIHFRLPLGIQLLGQNAKPKNNAP